MPNVTAGTTVRNLPRPTRPELIEAGDLVSVDYPAQDGVSMSRRGRVAHVGLHAGMRVLTTQEGNVIARIPVTGSHSIRVILVEREPMAQAELDLFTV